MEILKRDGQKEKFDSFKIKNAIIKAFESVNIKFDEKIYLNVIKKVTQNNINEVEEIQNTIEKEIFDGGYFEVLKSFINHRNTHKIARASQTTFIDCSETIKEYISGSDWRINANSNTSYSNAGLINNTAGKVIANYWLDEIYSKKEGFAHRNGDFHIHDLDCLTGYCFSGDTKVKLVDGRNLSFLELIKEFGRKDTTFEVYSVDKKGQIVKGVARNPRMIERNANLVEIIFDNPNIKSIKCTPDHKFFLSNGDQKEAKDLRPEDDLLVVSDLRLDLIEKVPDNRSLSYKAKYMLNYNTLLNSYLNSDMIDNVRYKEIYKYYIAKKELITFDEFVKKYIQKGNVFSNTHRVGEVKILDKKESVYCLSVDEFENFALEDGFIVHNCAGWSLRALLNEGFNGVRGRVDAKAPNHFKEALYQMANFLGILQSEWAGAQAFSSFDTYLAPYLFKDKLSDIELKKAMTNFIYNLNVPARWGQSPFTNVTIDLVVPKDLKDQIPTRNNLHLFKNLVDEELLKEAKKRGKNSLEELTYGDFEIEMQRIVIAFYEILTAGDKNGQPFTFPIPTINITENTNWDTPAMDAIMQNTAKMGSSYFQNFIGSQYIKDEFGNKIPNPKAYKPDAIRSMCCRLQLDLRELLKRGGGLFGSAEMTGSIGVVTINLARLGYLYKRDEKGLFKRLRELCDLAKSSLEKKREFIKKMYDRGLYPYTKRYLPNFNNHFSTIGINGANEMIRNFSDDKEDISTEFGQKFALKVINFIRELLISYQEESGNLYNLEATPAEGTTYRFAREDKKRYFDIIQAGEKDEIYYTNSTQLPANFGEDPFLALDLQDELQSSYTGGTVFHLYMKEALSSIEVTKKLLKAILNNYKLPYITITPIFSVCPIHGHLKGEWEYCPLCDEELKKIS